MRVSINYLAVVVVAVVGFILGWIWYSALFGKAWAAARGVTEEQRAEGQKHLGRNMVVVAISLLIMAWSLAVVTGYLHLGTWLQGLKLGVVLWFGFVFTVGWIDHVMTTGRKVAAFCIDAGYWVVTAAVMGIILAVWH